jgi:uncharacterized membrane protein
VHDTIANDMNKIKLILRIILGLFMLYAGIGHLTFLKQEFHAQVPTWLTTDKGLMDSIVIISGIVEIAFGLLMIIGGKLKIKTGFALALFFILIYPGNINQYTNAISAFGLDTDTKRLVRLFFQPALILWALWSTEAILYLKTNKKNI